MKTGFRKVFFAILLLVTMAGCMGKKEGLPRDKTIRQAEGYPGIVAVLPFGNTTGDKSIADQVRHSFFNHFSSKPFVDIELSNVNKGIAKLEKELGKPIYDIEPDKIGKALNAGGIIYGKVLKYSKVYAVAYSRIGVEAEVWMVNAATGKELWRVKESVDYRQGGVPLSPIGAVMTAVSTAMNVRDMQRIRVVNELGWKLNQKITVPEGISISRKPVIRNVISNAKKGPFGSGRVVKVAMEGEKGLTGLFTVGGISKVVSMKEVSPGEYLGEYVVVPGDNVKDAPIMVYLRRPSGDESRWLDISGFATIDTNPPPPVTDIKGRSFVDRIVLSWKGVTDSGLKEYKVLRSTLPLTEYKEIAVIEEPVFEDKNANPRQVYYYKVAAVDIAGNESVSPESVKHLLRRKDIVSLPDNIVKDTTLYAGQYMVSGEITVEKGVRLVIRPDTRIFFKRDASINVLGELQAEGDSEFRIEFLAEAPSVRWKGFRIKGDKGVLRFVKVSGAVTALLVENGDVSISNSVFEGNGTAIVSIGIPSVKLTDSTVWHNNNGVEIDNSRAELLRNEITQNKTGISVRESSPVLKNNNIYNNSMNVSVGAATLSLDGNFLGSINTEKMKIEGETEVENVLDAPYPDGKIVAVKTDPYSTLSEKGKKEKLAEMLLNAESYFRARNFGKAASLFEETLKIKRSASTYYYIALSYQGMDENGQALAYLGKGVKMFPEDSSISKAYGLMLYQLGRNGPARGALEKALKLNPGDRQIRFFLDRLKMAD